ncbi:MAG: hydrogenase iron-sulfur subunit [Planctomycetes bacterium]|nr:hydrogenase iron-sulfur subunit [Planctomycetota bacterium]
MDDQTLKLYVFYCSNSLPREELSPFYQTLRTQGIKAISLPCSGKLDVPYLMKAFETGAHGAAIVMCEQNECRHLEGNMRAQKRAHAVASLLTEVGLGQGRLTVIYRDADGMEGVLRKIEAFRVQVGSLPQSIEFPSDTVVENPIKSDS